jgi:hypothetical protein
MNDRDKQLRRDWKAKTPAIRRVLLAEWNPIGFDVPEDEYDSDIPVIYRLVHDRVGIEAPARHLGKSESESMGLSPDAKKNERIAQLLMALME